MPELSVSETVAMGYRRRSPALWAEAITQGTSRPYLIPRHVQAIDETVMALLTGTLGTDILIVEEPPRHGKSEYVSKRLPAWFLGRYPDRDVILAGHEADFAESWGRKARDIVAQHGRYWWDVGISDHRSAAGEWLTSHGGSMKTAGVGGSILGRGAHLFVIDDYLKNAEQALSLTIRDKQWDWWQSTVLTRLEPGAKVIVNATRWHDDDLTGRIIKQAIETGIPVARLRLPAIAEEDDPLGRQPGEALWPERYSTEKLDLIRRRSDLFWWLAIYQQRPSIHARAEWPESYFAETIWSERWPDAFELTAMFIDPSKGQTAKPGDYFAVVFVGLCGGKIWVDARMSREKHVNAICDETVAFAYEQGQPIDGVGLEGNFFQDIAFETLFANAAAQAGVPPLPLMSITNRTKKELRISRLGPRLQNGQLRFRNTPGTRLLVRQLREFPLGDHDDGPDALEGAVRLLTHLASEGVEDTMQAEDATYA